VQRNRLGELLEANGVQQVEVAKGIGRTKAFVSRLLSGETGASQGTIAALLAFLSRRLGRPVTYEELFGGPAADPLVEPAPADPSAGAR
jgi:transcriptional regulator with XRE-family HTH domain